MSRREKASAFALLVLLAVPLGGAQSALGFRPPTGSPSPYVNPFSITDVSPDAPYGVEGSVGGLDPASNITSLVLDQQPAPPGGNRPPPTLWAGTPFAGVWRSTDGARTWRQTSFGIPFGVSRGDRSLGETYLAFDGSDATFPQRLLFATIDDDSRRSRSFGGLYVSIDGADSWRHIDLHAAGGTSCPVSRGLSISSVVFASGRPFVATTCGIFTTTDTRMRDGWSTLPSPPFQTFQSLLASDRAGTLFACKDTGVYESQNLGQSWIASNAPLSGTGSCRALAADPLNGISQSRTVVELSDYASCPADPMPLPPTCNYEVSTVEFSNVAGGSDQRRTFLLPSERESGCCGHPYVFTALRADRPQDLDIAGLSYDIYAADRYRFYVFSGSLSSDGDLIGSARWTKITDAPAEPYGIHVDTWGGAASPTSYAPSANECDVWLANDGGVYQNFSARYSTEGFCTPGSGWRRAMAGLHAFGSTSISGASRPQSECFRQTEPCPALYVASEHNDTWGTAQARAGANWGIMDDTLGDSGSTFIDPALPYQLVTGREGGGGCHLALYYSTSSQTPPFPGDIFNVYKGDRERYECFDPPNIAVGGLEPPGNAAFSQVRKVPSDSSGSLAEYVTVDNDPTKGDAIVDRIFSAGVGPKIDSGWFELNPSNRFAAGQVAAIKTSGGQRRTVNYVLTQSDGNGYAKGHVYRGVENAANSFTWRDVSGSDTAPTRVERATVLLVDPYNPDNLFVVDDKDQNIKSSFDGGDSWQVDTQLTDIANGHGTFTYRCNVDPGEPVIVTNGCILKDMHFVRGHPEIRVATTLPGGVAFSRDYGRHWIDLDVTNTGTSYLSKRNPQPIQSPAGAFYDPTPNPKTGEPSLYISLRGAGVERIDGPFSHLGAIYYDVRCEACKTLTVFDDTTGKFGDLSRYPDGVFRMTELLDLSGIGKINFHIVVDGVETKQQVITLSGGELDSGVVSVPELCSTGEQTACKQRDTGLPQTSPQITEFQVPPPAAFPQGITRGPDSAMWFTLIQQPAIARVDDLGQVREFPLPDPNSRPQNITTGPDGNLWFTERGNFCGAGNRIGRLTPLGTLTEFALPASCSEPYDITAGPDGALWFTELHNNKIGRITVTGSITEFPLPTGSPGPGTQGPLGIALGPDRALWFTETVGNKIGRVTAAGQFSEFPIPTARSGASGITAGSDGNLWFTEFFANQIARITPGGLVTEFRIPTADSQPPAIAAGPRSGSLWFTEFNSSQIGRITADGVITEFPTPTAGSGPAGIAAGPRDTERMWFTEINPNRVATFPDL